MIGLLLAARVLPAYILRVTTSLCTAFRYLSKTDQTRGVRIFSEMGAAEK